jgi:hypothetical protein
MADTPEAMVKEPTEIDPTQVAMMKIEPTEIDHTQIAMIKIEPTEIEIAEATDGQWYLEGKGIIETPNFGLHFPASFGPYAAAKCCSFVIHGPPKAKGKGEGNIFKGDKSKNDEGGMGDKSKNDKGCQDDEGDKESDYDDMRPPMKYQRRCT